MASADVDRTTRPAPREAAAASAARRDPFFDNAKFLTILLVACGHAWEPLTYGSRAVTAVYLTVYAFHMPAFALISGYFSRGFDLGPRRAQKLLTGIVVPYVIFELAYTYFYKTTQHDPAYPISLLDPWYVMWFLVALFIWRLTTPVWRVLRYPLPIALAIAALAACSPDVGGDLSLQRVLQFLPFFVAGLVVRPEHVAFVRSRTARWAALPVAAVALAVAYAVAPWFNAGWFYHRGAVTGMGAPQWAGLISTPVLFVGGLVLTACFLSWVPQRRGWLTVLGTGTMYGYLLHGFIIKSSRFWDWYDHPWLHTPQGEIAVTLMAVVGMSLLCSPPVRKVFRPVVEPRLPWAFRRPEEGGAKAGAGASARPGHGDVVTGAPEPPTAEGAAPR